MVGIAFNSGDSIDLDGVQFGFLLRLLIPYLDDDLTNVLTSSHETEGWLQFLFAINSGIQWLDNSRLDTFSDKFDSVCLGNTGVIGIEQGIQKNSVECNILQEDSHSKWAVVGQIVLANFKEATMLRQATN